jgi:hypothetical protein
MKSFMFVVLVALFVLSMNVAVAQPTGSVPMTATVTTTPLVVAPGTFDASTLVAGHCYRCPADIQILLAYDAQSNQVANAVALTIDETIITGDPLESFLLTLDMPQTLTPTSAGPGLIHCSYDNFNAATGLSGAEDIFFNPQGVTQKEFQLDATGNFNLCLTANLCVDANSTTDTYQGDALVIAERAGTTP